jgi:hypothetical protein
MIVRDAPVLSTIVASLWIERAASRERRLELVEREHRRNPVG